MVTRGTLRSPCRQVPVGLRSSCRHRLTLRSNRRVRPLRRSRDSVRLLSTMLVLAGVAALPAAAAFAAYPGANGKIAFGSGRSGNGDIWAMNPDGSGQTRLTDSPAADQSPAWS